MDVKEYFSRNYKRIEKFLTNKIAFYSRRYRFGCELDIFSAVNNVLYTLFAKFPEIPATADELECDKIVFSWLAVTARRRIKDDARALHNRRKHELLSERAQTSLFDIPEHRVQGTTLLEVSEEREKFEEAMWNLPEQYAVPILLVYYDEMSSGAIAEYLKVDQATVRNRLKKARRILGKICCK